MKKTPVLASPSPISLLTHFEIVSKSDQKQVLLNFCQGKQNELAKNINLLTILYFVFLLKVRSKGSHLQSHGCDECADVPEGLQVRLSEI